MATNLSSHTETPARADAFPPFQRDTFASQLIWLAISFGLLYVLVAKMGLPRVGAILENRRRRIADDFAEADRIRTETQSAVNAYASALNHARNRADILAGKMQLKLKTEAKRNREKLEMDIKARLSQAESAITAAKAAAVSDVRGIAVESASAIVARLIGGVPPRDMVLGAVDRVLRR